jgi:hypothetical protein
MFFALIEGVLQISRLNYGVIEGKSQDMPGILFSSFCIKKKIKAGRDISSQSFRMY